MVKSICKLSIASIMILQTSPAAFAAPLTLTQKEAAELALNKGSQAREINLAFLQKKLPTVQVLSSYDWNLTAQSGYEEDKSASFSTTSAEYKKFTTTAQLKKSFITGTALTFDYSRISQRADGLSSSSIPPQATLDVLGLTVEQNLLANSFGKADRAKVRAAETQYKADAMTRANELEDIVLQTLAKYWNAYVAQENFKESLAVRDRYKKLVENVRRKSGFGYTSPGELSQIQAELEGKEQVVKKASLDYLQQMDSLNVWLDLPAGTEIDFNVGTKVPTLPNFDKKAINDLREVKAQNLKVEAATDTLRSSKSNSWPTLSFIGQLSGSGRDETANGSWSNSLSGTNNKFYAGLKMTYNFGSDVKNEDIVAKRAALDIESSKLGRQIRDSADKQENTIRKVQSTYAIVESAATQKKFREQTVNELTRTFNQGRTDISKLIDAMNAYFTTQIAYTRAMGDYYIALNEWAAIRDELIPDINDTNAITIKEDFE